MIPDLTMTELSRPGDWWLWRMECAQVWQVEGSGEIVVPAGFISDGPTVPRLFWNLFPVWGRYGRAGVLHDYLCARITLLNPHPAAPTRLEADRIFLAAMVALDVGWLSRTILFLSVRIGARIGLHTTMWAYNKGLGVILADKT